MGNGLQEILRCNEKIIRNLPGLEKAAEHEKALMKDRMIRENPNVIN
jgi:hypothetical protein